MLAQVRVALLHLCLVLDNRLLEFFERHLSLISRSWCLAVRWQTASPQTEHLALSAVHGLPVLALEGPLHRLTRAQTRGVGERLLEMVEQGLQG